VFHRIAESVQSSVLHILCAVENALGKLSSLFYTIYIELLA
jgi:hypothetical protein